MQPGFDALPLRKDYFKHFRRALEKALPSDRAVARAGLGSSAVGDLVFTSATQAAARTAIGFTSTVVDRAYAEYLLNADITTVTPLDDTIPQITEGVQILSIPSFTPKSATNRLRLRFQCECTIAVVGGTLIAAFHTSASSNAIASVLMNPAVAGYGTTLVFEKEYVPGSTSPITLSLRLGVSSGASFRLNGNNSSRFLGGSMGATFTVEELTA